MEDLEMIVKEVLVEESQATKAQAYQLEMASKIVDDLIDRGLVEAPSYKLAPAHSVLSRSVIAAI